MTNKCDEKDTDGGQVVVLTDKKKTVHYKIEILFINIVFANHNLT